VHVGDAALSLEDPAALQLDLAARRFVAERCSGLIFSREVSLDDQMCSLLSGVPQGSGEPPAETLGRKV
jgi:hypothetical protein